MIGTVTIPLFAVPLICQFIVEPEPTLYGATLPTLNINPFPTVVDVNVLQPPPGPPCQ